MSSEINKKIKIGSKEIGINKPCYIIAEAGVNHNGSLFLAKKLVDAAKQAGADAIKFQTFKTEGVMIKTAAKAAYQRKTTGGRENQFEMLKKLELSFKDFIILKKYCDTKKITFLSTPHSPEAIDFLFKLVPAYKIGSGDITNLPFLSQIARKGKPIILSTGMANWREIEIAIKQIESNGNKKIILTHCTTSYPCSFENVNLLAMVKMRERFNYLTGYSDHTVGHIVPLAARALGAVLIEKHFTLNKKLIGPDHAASADPEELKEIIKEIRILEKALGNGIKKPFLVEKEIASVVRKSITSLVDIKKGEIIEEKMLAIRRPGNGISPFYLNKIIGRRAKKNIKKDTLIKWSQII